MLLYIEIFFIMFISFAFIIVPSFLGCFGTILFWGLILSLFIFLSLNIKWIILFTLGYFALVYAKKYYKYLQTPTLDEYLKLNPDCYNNEHGVICANCRSSQQANIGVFSAKSRKRFSICFNCRKILYKFEII